MQKIAYDIKLYWLEANSKYQQNIVDVKRNTIFLL